MYARDAMCAGYKSMSNIDGVHVKRRLKKCYQTSS